MALMRIGDNLVLLLLLLLVGQSQQQTKLTYDLEDFCLGPKQPINLQISQMAIVRIGGKSLPGTYAVPCYIAFTTDQSYLLQVSVNVLQLDDCNVTLTLFYSTIKTYTCPKTLSESFNLPDNQVTVDLKRGRSSVNYNFEVTVKPSTAPYVPTDTTESHPVSVGLVVGIVVGVMVFLILIIIIAVCFHRRMQRAKRQQVYNSNQTKKPLDMAEGGPGSVGYSNEVTGNDYQSSPRAKTKLLSTEERAIDVQPGGRPKALSLKNGTPPDISNLAGSPKKSTSNFVYDDEDPYDTMEGDERQPKPKTPILCALHSNPRFKKSFEENERDADDRRKRVSSSSLGDSQGSYTSNESQDPPPLPAVKVMSKSPGTKKKNIASIRRAPRPISSSSDDAGHISRSGEDTSDPNIRVIHDSDSPSSSEMVPIKVQTPGKSNAQHTLRPNRGKSPVANKKNQESNNKRDKKVPDSKPEYPPSRVGQFQKYEDGIRSSKRSNKSPKLASKGFGHRRNRGDNDSRPTTPTSTIRDDDEDLESLPPLERATSKNSLYASRSSLYNRRRRKGSYSESVASYAHDDIDFYRRSRRYSRDYDDESDGYEHPISRHENDRMFKSLGDLEHERREQATRSTQTLRETATQTGDGGSVVVHKKRTVQRKRRSKSLSAASTQTKSRGKKPEKQSEDETVEKKPVKTKKSTEDLSVPDKPKPKPKPKPRNLQSKTASASEDDDSKKSSEVRRSKRKKKKKSVDESLSVDKTDAAVEQPQVVEAQGAPGAPPNVIMPQYPPGAPQPAQPYMQYTVPPGYQTMPHPQIGQMPQGQPVMVNGQPTHMVAPMPYNTMQPQVFGMRPPPPSYQQPPQAPPKPKKSKWEMLCEMTDPNGKNDEVTETGSVSSSVFTSLPPGSYTGYATVPYNPQYPINHPVAMTTPEMPHPTVANANDQISRVPPAESEGFQMKEMSVSAHSDTQSESSGSSVSGSSSHSEPEIPSRNYALEDVTMGKKKSSWDALVQMTDPQSSNTTTTKNGRTESFV